MNIIRKLRIILFFAVFAAVCAGCNGKNSEKSGAAQEAPKTEEGAKNDEPAEVTPEQLGYAFGIIVGKTAQENEFKINTKAFLKGFKAASAAGFKDADLTEAQEVINRAYHRSHLAYLAKKLEESKKFLEENKKKDGIIVTDSGLQYEILQNGKNEVKPAPSDTVEVHYTGSLTDGTVFDDSYKNAPDEKAAPVKINLARVIPGWTEGVCLMSPGAKFKFYIPPELGYGEKGIKNNASGETIIPENAVLVFEIELVSIEPAQ